MGTEVQIMTAFHAVCLKSGWAVRRDGDSRAKATKLERKAAWLEACRLAKEAGGEAYMHEEDGRVIARQIYA